MVVIGSNEKPEYLSAPKTRELGRKNYIFVHFKRSFVKVIQIGPAI